MVPDQEKGHKTVNPSNDAIAQVAAAIEQHGEPKWLCHVPFSVRHQVPKEIKQRLLADARVSEGWTRQGDRLVFGRGDARETLRLWAQDNVLAEMTTREIADAAGVPQSTVRAMISERPDIFRKSEGRTYEIRNPQEDRKQAKR